MKLYFAGVCDSTLFHPHPTELSDVREIIAKEKLAEETASPFEADAIIIQENNEFKGADYVHQLVSDTFISTHLTKIFTVSADDSATGLFRGLYTSIPKVRFNQRFHRAIPYIRYTNGFVFSNECEIEPSYLAGWYGNVKSNRTRNVLLNNWQKNPLFLLKKTDSWYDHQLEEQKEYVELIKNSKFSLCPAGWAPPSPRIYESMALGRCPIIIADEFVRPYGPKWDEFALFYPQHCVTKIDSFLLQHEHRYKELGEKAKDAWDEYFAGDLIKRYCVNTLFELIQSTPSYTKEEEMNRWHSFGTYWKNKWTIPQRLLIKYNRLLKKS